MSMARDSNAQREFTGYHMLAILFVFFGVTIAVNLALAYYANSTWTGLVVENGYVASQEFNNELAEGRREKELGWQPTFALAAGKLAVSLADKGGLPLSGLEVSVEFGRPAHEGQDHSVKLTSVGSGKYEADAPLAPGLWTAVLLAKQDGKVELRREYRFVVKP